MDNLKWLKIGSDYRLISPTDELIRLAYEPLGRTTFTINGEMYAVERTGSWNLRYRLTGRQGEITTVSHTFWGSHGDIRFADGTSYHIDYPRKPLLTLRFLEEQSEILHYRVSGERGQLYAVFSLGYALLDADKVLTMAALGLVIFLDIFHEFNEGSEQENLFLVLAATG